MPVKHMEQLVDPKILAIGETMRKAIEVGDFEGFVRNGSPTLKAEMTRETFQVISNQLAPRMKEGCQFSFVVERLRTPDEAKRDIRIFLWRIKFVDGDGDFDFYLNLKDGLVESICCHMVWPVDGLAYVAMWMSPLVAGLVFPAATSSSTGCGICFSVLIGLPVGATIMLGNMRFMRPIERAWIGKYQVRLLKKPTIIFVNIVAFAWAIFISALAAIISVYFSWKVAEFFHLE